MWRALVDALAAFENEPAVRCVVITGQGDKAFCVGADIGEKDRAERESPEDYERVVIDSLNKIQAFPKPTIAMISGYCLGGGVALAIACDLRLAGVESRFGVPAAKLGLACFYPIVKRLADLVGASNAKRIIFTGDRFSSEEALRFGLIDELVSPGDLSATVKDMATRIAANAPLTIAAAKHAVETVFSEAADRDRAGCAERERACLESRTISRAAALSSKSANRSFTAVELRALMEH